MLYFPITLETREAEVMGSVKRDIDRSRHLADVFDYTNPASMRRAIRNLLTLQLRAEQGCPTSVAILVDLKTALGCYGIDELLGRRVLTAKQREAMILHLVEDQPIPEVAKRLGIDTTAVTHRINGGIRRIIRFLETGYAGPWEWTEEETEYLRTHYWTDGAKMVAEALGRPVSQIYAKARTLKSA